jgi:hypothetical protein
VLEIDERIRRPHQSPEFVAGDEIAGPLQQDGENLKWLFLESYFNAIAV